MTDTIKRLRAMHEAATKGPWEADYTGDLRDDSGCDLMHRCVDERGEPDAVLFSPEDAALIAEMRNALPALLDVVEAWDAYDGGEEHGDVYLMVRYAEIREARARLDG